MPNPATPLTWTDWYAARDRARAGVAVAVIAITFVLVATMDPWLAVIGGAAMLASTAEALVPLHYELTTEGVSVRGWLHNRQVAWADVASWSRAPDGFVLRGRGGSGFLRRRRTVRLRCPGREHVVSQYLADALPGPGTGT